MTYQQAVSALRELRLPYTVVDIYRTIRAYESAGHGANRWEHAVLLLVACDVLAAHDLGDYSAQERAARQLAARSLRLCRSAAIELELRLLAHLQADFTGEPGGPASWKRKRLSRARRWLQALRAIEEETDSCEISDLPSPKLHSMVPGRGQGGETEKEYLAVQQNLEAAEEAVSQRNWEHLREVYEPIAARFLATAYGQPPFDLRELQAVLNDNLGWKTRSGLTEADKQLVPDPQTNHKSTREAGVTSTQKVEDNFKRKRRRIRRSAGETS